MSLISRFFVVNSSFLFCFIQKRLWRSVKNSYILIITPSIKSRSSHGNEPQPFISMKSTPSYPGLGMTGKPVE